MQFCSLKKIPLKRGLIFFQFKDVYSSGPSNVSPHLFHYNFCRKKWQRSKRMETSRRSNSTCLKPRRRIHRGRIPRAVCAMAVREHVTEAAAGNLPQKPPADSRTALKHITWTVKFLPYGLFTLLVNRTASRTGNWTISTANNGSEFLSLCEHFCTTY